MSGSGISRRSFLKSGGSIAVAFTLLPELIGDIAAAAAAGPPVTPGLRVVPSQPLAPAVQYADTVSWLLLEPNGVTIHTGRVELGTGIRTAMTQIALEELHLDLKNVTYVQGDTRRTADEGFTAGSKSLQNGGPLLRRAAALAFQELVGRAAAELNVPASSIVASNGRFRSGGRGRVVTYQQLLSRGDALLVSNPATTLPPVVPPAEYVLVGRSVPRQDLPDKIFAAPTYVQDVVVEGMLHGRVIRPSGRNATFASITPASLASAQAIPGFVGVVQQGNFVGVLGTTEWAAIAASQARTGGLQVNWNAGPPLVAQPSLPTALRDPANIYGTNPEHTFPGFQTAYDAAPVQQSADYFTPFQMHASFGPTCAVADVRATADPTTGVKATVWSQTQGVYPLRRAVAGLLDIGEAEVHVIYEEGAGCYGHDGADDVAGDAALMSKLAGAPVRVQWSRQDEHGWEPLGPAMSHSLQGAVGADGEVAAWSHTVWSPTHNSRPSGVVGGALIAGTLIGKLPNPLPSPTGTNSASRNAPVNYSFGAFDQGTGGRERLTVNWVRSFNTGAGSRAPTSPLTWRLPRSTALRSLGGFSNSFANESFMSELAVASGQDELAFRLRHLTEPRANAVLAALGTVWATRPTGVDGVGAGIAFQRYETDDAWAAGYVEVEVDRATGVIRVRRAVIAHDCGLIVNPDGLRNQIEGNVMQGVSRTLMEEVQYSGDRVTSTIWERNPLFFINSTQYPVISFNEVPVVETILIDRPDQPALGAGEPTIGVMGGAIGNAVYHAVGIRLRSLPMLPTKVLAALAALQPA